MPISREHFQIGNPGDETDLAEEGADVFDAGSVTSIGDPSEIIDSENTETAGESKAESASGSIGDEPAPKSTQAVSKEISTSLPSADTTSAEKREAVGAAHPQREAHRSVTSGRDVPQFTSSSKERDRNEFNWEEARAQKDAATEHLARIHDVVGLLIEMSEAHSNDARTKLQSLESKVAELETRFSVNRLSP